MGEGLPITNCIQAVKSSKQASGANDPKTSGVKKATDVPVHQTSLAKQTSGASNPKPSDIKKAAVPIPQTTLAKPSTSSRTTNNSLSNLLPVPAKKSPLPMPATQTSYSRSPPPPRSTSNGHNVLSRSTTSNSARHTPLVVQTGSGVKIESPQMGSLNSPATLSAIDRLAPIRAAKASLTSGTGVQSPSVSMASETRTMLSPGVNTPQTPVDIRQNPAVPQPGVYQTTELSQPPPPPPIQSSSQLLPANSGQGRNIPAQLEGVLQALHSQFPQLGFRPQSNNGVNPATFAPNMEPSGIAGHPTAPLPMPGFVNTGSANNSGHTSQGPYNGNITGTQANPNQSGSYGQWPSSSWGISGNATSQPQSTMNFMTPTPAGLHTLPQRPIPIPSAPSSSTRAEPLGPSSRPAPSQSATLDGRRGPYNNNRHRPPDDRRSSRHDRNQDDDRSRGNRNRYHRRS